MLTRVLPLALLISGPQIDQLLGSWGYGLVLAIVLLQASGVPVPGTTVLAAASIYAGSTHRLAITGVIGAAAAGAIIGYAISFALGRWGGWRLVESHGHRVRLTADRIEAGRAFFSGHGGKIVFFGRFVTGLRTWGAFIAGANLMPWPRFIVLNVLGGLAWSVLNGLGYYYFGDVISSAGTVVQIALVFAGLAILIVSALLLRRRARSVRRPPSAAAPKPSSTSGASD